MKHFFITFLFLVIPFSGFSQIFWTDPETGILYTETSKNGLKHTAQLTLHSLPTPRPQVVKFPDFYHDYKVDEVTFYIANFPEVKKVILPKYATRIPTLSGFFCAEHIEEIVWNPNLEYILHSVCANTYKLKEVDLSNTKVTYIGFMAFYAEFPYKKSQLNSFKLSPCIKELHGRVWDGTPLKTLTLPASLEKITQYTFHGMGKLEELIFENPTPPALFEDYFQYSNAPLTGGQLFERCPKLKTVHLPVESSVDYKATMCFKKTKELYYEKLTIGSTGYTSYYLEKENFRVPTGCTAYIITGVTPSGSMASDQAIVKTFSAGKIIPKQTGFILKGPANSTVLYQAAVDGIEENVSGNLLVGTATEQEFSSADHKYYVLAAGDQGLGFYKQGTRAGASIKLKPHRAGLRLPAAIARAKHFIVDFDAAREEAETTGIRNARPSGQSKDNAVYDLQGRRVTPPTRGIYIVNGKKVIINK